MGKLIQLRPPAESLSIQWRLTAERALYVCRTSEDLRAHAEAFSAYVQHRSEVSHGG